MNNWNSKHLIFCEKGSFKVIKSILKANNADNTIICMDDAIHEKLYSEGVDHNRISDYKLDFDVELKALDWLKNWSNSKIFHGKNIKELFIHEGISLWWFMELAIFYPFKEFKYSPSIKELIQKIELVKKVIDIEKPAKVTVINTENPLNRIIVNVAYSWELKTDYIKTYNILFKQILWTLLIPIGLDMFVKSRAILRGFISNAQKNKKRGIKKSGGGINKILIMSYTLNWRNSKDVMFDDVIKELVKNKENEIVQVDIPTTSLIGVKQVFEKKRMSNNVTHKMIEEYSINNIDIIKKSIKNIKEIYAKNKDVSIYYEDVVISQFVYQQLDLIMHHYGISNYIKYIEWMKNVIHVENPDIILLIDEYNPIGRATVVAGKICNIPTLAMQHGVIGQSSMGYFHKSDEISKNDEYTAPYYPLSDYTAVFGPYYSKLLHEIGNYPTESIIITGSPRYDELAQKKFDKEKICANLGINHAKKIVVLATEAFPIKSENEKYARAVFSAVEKMGDVEFVVKIHPYEIDYSIYLKIAKEFDISPIFTRTTDIYEIISISDVVIISYSTVGLEALLLDKVLLSINLTGRSNPIPYTESKSAIGVTKNENVQKAIYDALYNRDIIDELTSNRRKFLYEHVYENDGNASKRVANAIYKIIG